MLIYIGKDIYVLKKPKSKFLFFFISQFWSPPAKEPISLAVSVVSLLHCSGSRVDEILKVSNYPSVIKIIAKTPNFTFLIWINMFTNIINKMKYIIKH